MIAWKKEMKSMERDSITFAVLVLICTICIVCFLNYYCRGYQNPYMMGGIYDLSADWQYQIGQMDTKSLDNLRIGPILHGTQTITLYKTLDFELSEAAILIRSNHQAVNIYLDGAPLYLDQKYTLYENPGMALHFILLPKNYLHKMLKIEITSPYCLYAGRTSPILMGTILSLQAYTLSNSMRSVILMAMCLLMGLCAIALTFVQALKGYLKPQNLAIGIFAVVWALYYVCTEYIVFQFFTPVQMSIFSLGFYFSFQVPLTLFFYFSFKHCKKWMLPAVVVHSGFVASAFALQLLGIVDLPQLININNMLLTGLIYTIFLSVREACKKNRMMVLSTPFLIIAYISMLHNFAVFYTRHGVVPYSYKDTYFLLILSVLICNVQQFFSVYYQQRKDSEVLILQAQLAKESYEQIKTHLQQVGSLKHEMKNHLAAMQVYLENGRYTDAKEYLCKYTEQTEAVTEAVYHEHFLVNAIVGKFLHAAKKIGVEVALNLRASSVHIADLDLYSLLTNMLENALDACNTVPEGQERFTRLTIARREPYLLVTCINSKSNDISSADGVIQTTKSGLHEHGYGLWTMTRIVHAYDGLMDIDYDQNTFTLTVALKEK